MCVCVCVSLHALIKVIRRIKSVQKRKRSRSQPWCSSSEPAASKQFHARGFTYAQIEWLVLHFIRFLILEYIFLKKRRSENVGEDVMSPDVPPGSEPIRIQMKSLHTLMRSCCVLSYYRMKFLDISAGSWWISWLGVKFADKQRGNLF